MCKLRVGLIRNLKITLNGNKEGKMKDKFYTVVVRFAPGVKRERITFNDKLLGGEITAMASYDVMGVADIAEEALERSTDDDCLDALEKINEFILEQTS